MWAPFDARLFSNEDGKPLIRIRDLNDQTIETYYQGGYEKKYIIIKGDHLIWMDGDFHNVLWQSEEWILNQRIMKISVWKRINKKYFYYLIGLPLKQINDLTYATTVKHLSDKDIRRLYLYIPTKEEQTRIATYLDTQTAILDEAIALKRRQIDLLREHRTALISHAVTRGLDPTAEMRESGVEWIGMIPSGWEVKKMKYAGFLLWGNAFIPEDYAEGWVLLVRIWEVKDSIDMGKAKFLPDKYWDIYKNFQVKKWDLLIAMTWYVGETSIFPLDDKALLNQRVGIIRNNKDFHPKFLFYLTRHDFFKRFLSLHSKSSAQENIGSADILKFIITAPPIEEQATIADYLDRETTYIDAMLAKIEESIILLEEYRTSLISHAVSGKIQIV